MEARRLIAVFVSATVCLTPATIRADDGPVPSSLEGKPGFRIPEALFEKMEFRYEDHPELERKLAERETEVKQLRISLHKKTESASTAMERRAFFKDAFDAERAAHALTREDAKRGFFESPTLWLVVGALTTGAIFYLTRDDSPDVVVAR